MGIRIWHHSFTVLSKSGHWGQWEKAEALNRLVIEFLRH